MAPVPEEKVVSYWNSTSNHNLEDGRVVTVELYLIEILHQTTTLARVSELLEVLYLIEILHQTTTSRRHFRFSFRLYLIEILHQTTTVSLLLRFPILLYLIEILHQTTTWFDERRYGYGCILLKFYIKPQRRASYWLIKCYLRAVCHYKNTIGCSDEASLMHFPYFKERK